MKTCKLFLISSLQSKVPEHSESAQSTFPLPVSSIPLSQISLDGSYLAPTLKDLYSPCGTI